MRLKCLSLNSLLLVVFMLVVPIGMGAQAPVTSFQLFDFNASLPVNLNHLQRADGTVDSTSYPGYGFALSSVMRVAPGATLTWHSPDTSDAGKGLFYGSGGPFPMVEYFQDFAATHLVASDYGISYVMHDQTFRVPTLGTINYVRVQLAFSQNYAYTALSGATLSTDIPYVPPAPTIVFAAIPVHNYTDAPFTVSASSNSTGNLIYTVSSGPATISGSTVTLTGAAGTVVLHANQAASMDYSAGLASQSFLVVMSNPGTPGPQGPSGLSAYDVAVANGYAGSQAAWLASLVGSGSAKPLAGMRCGFLGDSLTSNNAWEETFLTISGCTEVFRDARPGRRIDQAFEAYGNDPYTGTNQGTVTISGSLPGAGVLSNTGTCGGGGNCGGKAGNTLAQDLANVDVLIAGYMTNDIFQSTPIGTVSNAPSLTFPEAGAPSVLSGTLYGYGRGFFRALYTAKPTVKVIFWGPYPIDGGTYASSLAAFESAGETIAREWGTPFFDGRQFGINVVTGSSANVYLSDDKIHPSSLGGKSLIGPRLARFAALFATQ